MTTPEVDRVLSAHARSTMTKEERGELEKQGRGIWRQLTVKMWLRLVWNISWRLALLAAGIATVWKVWR